MTDELKIWALHDGNQVEPIESVSGVQLEDVLEETLVQRPDMLEPELQLVGRQTPASGGALDLLGVDASGQLVVFELKRGTLARDAVTQCIDYGSWLAEQDITELAKHISEHSGTGGIEPIRDFEEWYQSQFGALDALLPPRLVLVGLGIDERAERMTRFLSKSDINLSVVTFYGFERGGETLLARYARVDSGSAAPKPGSRQSIAERRKRLNAWLSECGLTALFNTVCESVRTSLPSAFENPTGHGISFQLQVMGPSGIRGPRTYFSVLAGYAEPELVTISLGGAALRENESALQTLRAEVDLRDWSHGNAGLAVFIASEEDWSQKREAVVGFVEATAKAWSGYRNAPQDPS